MPSISGNAALEVLIGLFFLYFLLSIVCSSINEGIAAATRLRAKYLERGLRKLLGEGNLEAFFANPRIRATIKPPGRLVFRRSRKPSYITSRAFALTVLDTFAPPDSAADSHDLIGRATTVVEGTDEEATHAPTSIVRTMLLDALNEERADIDKFRASLEHSYDEVMDRVSGWYKRRVQLILFFLAVGLTCAMNADSFAIGQRLWRDPATRSAVVSQANQVVQSGSAECAKTDAETTKADAAAACVEQVKEFGLPLGWSRATAPHDFWAVVGKILGLLVTGFAVSLGAPFWFDLLNKVSNLRGAGPAAPGAQEKKS
jgi:hypothetical protein